MVDGVVELHLDDVADLAFGLGAQHVERIRVDAGVRVAHQREEPDLRAVAVRDDEPVPARDGREQSRRLARGVTLGVRLQALAATQQGVAAERDDDDPFARPAHGAGTCCVMQWMLPAAEQDLAGGDADDLAARELLAEDPEHLRVAALVQERNDHARRADVEVRVRAGEAVPGAPRKRAGRGVDATRVLVA